MSDCGLIDLHLSDPEYYDSTLITRERIYVQYKTKFHAVTTAFGAETKKNENLSKKKNLKTLLTRKFVEIYNN